MKISNKSITRVLMIVSAAIVSVTSTASAQIFYVTSGNQGGINRFNSAGTNTGNLISYGAGINVQGIAVDSGGTVFASVTQSGTTTIRSITAAGSSSTFTTLTNGVNGLEFSSGGSLYGVRAGGGPSGGNDVGIYTVGGFTAITLTTSPFAPFFSAQSVRFDNNGDMYVANGGSGGVYANSIVKLTASGVNWAVASTIDTAGFAAYDMAFDNLNNLYVSSATSSAPVPIRKYSSAGVLDNTFAVSGGSFGTPRGLVFANGSLYEADLGTNRVNQINPSTGVASIFGVPTNFNLTYIAYTAVPEPSSVALLSLGAVMSVLARRKRKQVA